MLDQLTYFQDYIEKVTRLRQEKSQEKLVGLEKTNQLIAKGVAIVVAGSNDLIITYFGSGAQRLKNDIDSYTTIIADSAASFVLVRIIIAFTSSFFFFFASKFKNMI